MYIWCKLFSFSPNIIHTDDVKPYALIYTTIVCFSVEYSRQLDRCLCDCRLCLRMCESVCLCLCVHCTMYNLVPLSVSLRHCVCVCVFFYLFILLKFVLFGTKRQTCRKYTQTQTIQSTFISLTLHSFRHMLSCLGVLFPFRSHPFLIHAVRMPLSQTLMFIFFFFFHSLLLLLPLCSCIVSIRHSG